MILPAVKNTTYPQKDWSDMQSLPNPGVIIITSHGDIYFNSFVILDILI